MIILALPLDENEWIQPYPALLYAALRERGVEVRPFSSKSMLTGRPDVVHLHWPEARSSGRLRAILFLAALSVARLRGVRVALTAHNVTAHDVHPSRFWSWYLDRFDRRVDLVLILSRASKPLLEKHRSFRRDVRWAHTPHGLFADAYPPPSEAPEARRRLGMDPDRPTVAFVGQVRPYKNVPSFLSAARSLAVQKLVAGDCSNPNLRAEIEGAAQGDANVHLHLHPLSPQEMIDAVSAASLVVLPYGQVLNSGTVMLALGSGRPVLVPDSDVFRELEGQVGPGWVHRFAAPLTTDDIARPLDHPAESEADLSAFAWDSIASATHAALASVVPLKRRSR